MKYHNYSPTFLLLLFVVKSIISPIAQSSIAPSSSVKFHLQEDCDIVFDQLTKDDGWFEQMKNPILTTQEQISERLASYSKAHDCLKDYHADFSSEEVVFIQSLMEYFLIFAGGFQTPGGETTLYMVSFTESDDPAIEQIRDEAGVEPPDGYIYVRFYTSREIMPDLVQYAFENEEVAGVTILTRYVAVLAEEKETWPQQALQRQTLPDTISHELIHAYINSTIEQQFFDLPTWYQEGVAIYFSGSGENHTIVTPDFTLSKTSPEDYQQYDINFKYLEAQLGRERLLELIKQSIAEADSSVLYQDLGITDDHILASRARTWKQKQVSLRIGAGSLFALLLILGIWRFAPEVRCMNCGHAGKKKDFVSGYCPNCRRPYDREVSW